VAIVVMDWTSRPETVRRIGVCLLFSVIAGLVAFRVQHVLHARGSDHLILWQSVHTLLEHGDPYRDDPNTFKRLFYPLPAVLLGLPFAWLSPESAAIAFVSCSAAVLGFAITRDGFYRVPIVFSICFFSAAQLAQTSIILLGFALIPMLRGLLVFKPNIGLALFAWRPGLRAALVGGVILLISLSVVPGWPAHWLAVSRDFPAHRSPMMTGIGACGLLGLLRWRRPEARLLVAMTVIPHGMYFYDDLPLWLIAATSRESMILSACSWLGWFGWLATTDGASASIAPWLAASLYVPCTIMVLQRPTHSSSSTFRLNRRKAVSSRQ
jgi:hypothetical protein